MYEHHIYIFYIYIIYYIYIFTYKARELFLYTNARVSKLDGFPPSVSVGILMRSSHSTYQEYCGLHALKRVIIH